jgi:FG-GAP repeat
MRIFTAIMSLLFLGAPAFSQVMEDQLRPDPLSTSVNFGGENTLWITGDYAFVGDPDDDGGRGVVSVFERSSKGTWSLAGELRDSAASPNDGFGWSVRGDGRYLIVGAYRGDDLNSGVNDTGAAFIFDLLFPSAAPTRLSIPAGFGAGDMFGFSVDICATSNPPMAIVGAPRTDVQADDEGTVLIYQFIGGSWVPQTVIDSATGGGSLFGRAVGITANPSISGQLEIIVGAPGGGAGDVVFYDFIPGGGWNQNTRIFGAGSTFGDGFGINVAIDENFAAVGAYTEDVGGLTKVGAAYVYKRDVMGWPSSPDLRVEGINQDDWFGLDLDLLKTGPETALLAVGIPQSDAREIDAGEMKIWERTGPSAWSVPIARTPVYGESGWNFGSGVALGIKGSRRLAFGGARVGKVVQVIDLDRDSASFTGRVSISPRLMPGKNTFKTYGIEPNASVHFIYGIRPGNSLYWGCATAFFNPVFFCQAPAKQQPNGELECEVQMPIYTRRFAIQAVEFINAGTCLSISDPVEF